MKAFACAVLLVALAGSACTSGDGTPVSTAKSGAPEAYCPLVVEMGVESALAGAELGESAGPEAVSGPEFARTRELLGELIEAAPSRVREAVDAASFEPENGEVADPAAAEAMWTILGELPASCTGAQTAECTGRLAGMRQETSPAGFTDANIASTTKACSAASYLAGTEACDTVALAILHDEGDGELPILQHFAERCG